MTNEAFQALLARGPVLLDGATGSNLMARGMPRGGCTEQWVLEHPEVRREMGERNRRVIRDYSLNAVLEQMAALYREELEAKG